MKKQPELTAQTKENLIEAFWQIYCEKGLGKITVKEITAKAGYNRSTFYEYFTDVYDVLDQIEKLTSAWSAGSTPAQPEKDFHDAITYRYVSKNVREKPQILYCPIWG